MGMFAFSHQKICANNKDILECLTEEEAIEVLKTVKWRSEKRKLSWGEYSHVEIFYGDKWLQLARADACDQVRTIMGWCSDAAFEANPLIWYRKNVRYGAHVTANSFYVLDSVTDG